MVFPCDRFLYFMENESGTDVLWPSVLLRIWDDFNDLGKTQGGVSSEKEDTASSFCLAGRYDAAGRGDVGGIILAMKKLRIRLKNYEGSFTVEATFVMGMVLFVMVSLIQTAYGQCRQVTGKMRLQEMVEVLRYRESEVGDVLSVDVVPYKLYVRKELLAVKGRVVGENWRLVIESSRNEPEEFMRFLTLIQE